MENDKNVEHEEIKEQESAKRAIEEVDDDSENIDERNKKLKSENTNKTDPSDHDPDPMTCDLVENDKSEKTDEINVEEKEDGGQKKVKPKINYIKKKKCVLLLSYCGSGYNGMQRNPGVKTIEEDLTNALFKARAISEDASRNYGKMSFQRCARTDKGVSAARQVVSLKHMVPYKELLPDINKHLEPKIRVFALKQVTRGFDCKTRCSSRTYEYLLPTFAFAPSFAHTTRDFRITNEILNELKLVLKKYEGTKNFHNFTSGKDFKEESAKRYIIRFQVASEPFLERNMEFLVLQVQGQSFMQHQIRKMIGLVIAIMKKYTGLDAIFRAFQHPKMDIPRAPGLGLVLDQVHFRSYNEKFGRDGFHEPLEWSECEDQIKEFKKKFIYSQIVNTEASTNSMMRWLTSLPTHTYSNEGMMDLQKNRDVNSIAENSAETKETEKQKDEEMSSNNSAMVSSEAASEKDSTTEPSNEENLSSCIAGTSTETGCHGEQTDREISSNHNTTVTSGAAVPSNEESSRSCIPAVVTTETVS